MHFFVLHQFLHAARAVRELTNRMVYFEDAVVTGLLEHARVTMQNNSPVRSGALRAGWAVRRFGYAEGGLTNTVAYTEYQFTGTRAHTIAPHGKALMFYAGGSQVFMGGGFTKRQHPGQKPNLQLWSALYGEAAYIEAELDALGLQHVVSTFPSAVGP